MGEIVSLLIGSLILILGVPIGNFLANKTKEELESGRKYFKILVYLGFVGGLVGLIVRKDVLLFTMFFISIVTLRSIKRAPKK